MEIFTKVITVLAAVFVVLVIAGRYFGLEKRRQESAEARITRVYASIREKGLITASDLIEIKEAASLCRGTASVLACCERTDTEEAGGKVRICREFYALSELERFIAADGDFVLVPGDTVSIRIESEKRGTFELPGLLRRTRLSVGGAM
jgi:hypothetical protein